MYHFPYTINSMNQYELPEPIDFEWDQNNEAKIFRKHGIDKIEAEQVFSNFHIVENDEKHSNYQQRYNMLGMTDFNTSLFIVFVIRNNKVRVISARRASQKERLMYEEAKKNTNI
jgi:uncharacterized protein